MHGMALLSLNRSLHYYIITFLHFPYAPMQEVAPRAVSTAEIIEARICSDHLSVSFLVIRFSFFFILARISRIFTAFYSAVSLKESRVNPCLKFNVSSLDQGAAPGSGAKVQSLCDFTLGPDPSIHCAPDFTSGPDPSIHCAPDFTLGPDPSEQFKAHW